MSNLMRSDREVAEVRSGDGQQEKGPSIEENGDLLLRPPIFCMSLSSSSVNNVMSVHKKHAVKIV